MEVPDPIPKLERGPQFDATDKCYATLERGARNDQVPGTYPVTLKPSVNCTFNVGGKIAYVGLPEDNAKTIAFITELPIVHSIEDLVADEFESEYGAIVPDGVYTWILYKLPGAKKGEFSWAFRKVRSILEVGTLHKSIARAVGAETIHAAGEIEKDKGELTINYLSGSYMLNDCDRKAKEIIMNQLFSDYLGYRPYKFTTNTLITAQPTMEELQFYANKGFRICLHEPEKVAECKAVKGTCADALKPQEGAMRGGAENLSIQGKPMPMTPRKAYMNKEIAEPTQASKARQVFASQGLIALPREGKERALSMLGRPVSPSSVGLGRKRKTRRGKKAKRRMTKKKW